MLFHDVSLFSAWMQTVVEKGSNAFSWMQAVSSQKLQKLLRSLGCSSDLQVLGWAEAADQLTAQKGGTDPTVCKQQFSPPISFQLEESDQLN